MVSNPARKISPNPRTISVPAGKVGNIRRTGNLSSIIFVANSAIFPVIKTWMTSTIVNNPANINVGFQEKRAPK